MKFRNPFNGDNDHQLANTKYAGRESASTKAARQRRETYRSKVTKTDRKGQAWEDRDRAQERRGTWYRPAR